MCFAAGTVLGALIALFGVSVVAAKDPTYSGAVTVLGPRSVPDPIHRPGEPLGVA
jgi:hypothetical protein